MKSRKTIEQDLQEILVAYKIGRITLEEAVRVIIFEINKVREETIKEVEDIVNKIIIKNYSKKWGDDVVDFAQDIVNRTTSLIKKELNKLKK